MGCIGPNESKLGFDPKVLQDKYRAERDKRLRSDGTNQYVPLDQDSLPDPYIESPITRGPIQEDIDFLTMGAGITNIRIVEKAGDFGGIWYWNRYPGAGCDTEAHIYMPLREELGPIPAEKYAKAPELRKHAHNIGDKALFQTELQALGWNEDSGRWIGTTSRNDQIRAKFVATASGPLQNAKILRFPRSETFKEHSFHTNRWDYGYTGGDTTGNLDKISDKRIGIIGTGTTAVQAVPHLAEGAKHLYLFQRTPSSVDAQNNQLTDPAWVASLTPGWQNQKMENFNTIVSGGQANEDLVNDGWTHIIRRLSVLGGKDQPSASADNALNRQLADFEKMEQIRARVDSTFCGRPCFYLPTFNRPNVILVDTDGQGIDKITEEGIVAGGKSYKLDCIIYATGFEYSVNHTNRSSLVIRGRGGLTLSEKWKNGASTLHGMHRRGFPNLYIISLLQSGVTPNLTHMLDEQAIHIAYITLYCMNRHINVLYTAADDESKWVQTIVELGKLQQDFVKECTPGYYNNEGKESELVLRNSIYGLGSPAFIQVLKKWRKAGKLDGLEYVRRAHRLRNIWQAHFAYVLRLAFFPLQY
ncbi:uncharacterized protein N7479_010366 [Penicillium vulpinum]|uniref:uncharacterized protein n=1 Tax=Penicillium vulpinum TaxID=29845 RepID=UPI0025470E11|nr:uncharacterized protein N7479_010366 [Penicillium vulpinum]KAJ5951953.1 hypothetical protein N7479_010366 [Penicillium vulpinum]